MYQDRQSRVVVIVSTGRTGTASIATNFRRRFPESIAVHEPFGSRLLRIIGNMYAEGIIGERVAGLIVRCTHGLRRMLAHNRPLIESNPHLCCLVPVILRLYPDTVIIHVVRNPDTFVYSYINHGAFHGLKGFLGRLIPFWFIHPERMEPAQGVYWSQLDPVSASAWRWVILNRVIRESLQRTSTRTLCIRYEDLFSDSTTQWKRISDAAALDPSRWDDSGEVTKVNQSTSTRNDTSPSSVHSDDLVINKICGREKELYGYS